MLNGKSILLGVSGGIAAYKAAELVRCFGKLGATVQVIMTAGAQKFITPLTLQALSGQPVCTDIFNLELESEIGHIHVARSSHLVVLAPATANLIGKMAAGIADDYLTTVLLATTAPVLICPAMNVKMYEHPLTQRNLQILREIGCHVLEPGVGSLACKEEGVGRLADLPLIVETAHRLLTAPGLKGRRVLVSAGPTWEPFDPVRYITNPSSGKMGYALAAVAARRWADVHLVSGPTSLPAPLGVHLHRVTTALEMKDAVTKLAEDMDVIIMAAAVSDYRPVEAAPQKIKKTSGTMTVQLEKNPDILLALGRDRSASRPNVLVGFAAETENLVQHATEKLTKKNLDFIVANNLTQSGAGFGVDTNQVKIIERSGKIIELPCLAKEEVAERILDRVEQLLADAAHYETD
ncbi:bifunctional phosphopantothenoylcysteine decarboxylase/phosphopantothenate--cysteine ligase CoaBC [Desulforhabdus amnigena]|jgi:phosphopantothenoylcysteine decarboxylase/phosphopantothenate--cysteine ligase|uniref:Coenzyme A biosynthesis bifunctional protein CoaBC n=1 Tax=Desulforhabdus amnigena TaxID=40218 RepID=A0A9W6D4X7_9BACT|nr:bifunctional phosphopantothenoylcysteine decarboxylase/phosphopantothenate--cysteine ligase CoaBC [Desulforhabdus amnigena]NLJ29224.1 bifunctional phosphopantothenoylcysteine decarboxylase/phosphopantothenate--cysteine ligase CoaBC [Deltaproteobacteria bacterium]GLI34242.1 peptidase ClpP [Desulforhabdus amnigena]